MHTTACSVLMISTLTSYSFLAGFPRKVLELRLLFFSCSDFVESFFLGISVFPRELLSGKLLAVFKQAELGSSVEVSSFAGSVVPANVSVRSSSVPKKLKSRLDASTTEISAYEARVHRLKDFFHPSRIVLKVSQSGIVYYGVCSEQHSPN